MEIAVILSRHQRVKSFIFSRTLLSRLFKPVAYTETTCDPDLSIDFVDWNHTSAWKYDILRNDYWMLQSFTKISFSLVWWQVWNTDSYHILTKGFLCWNIYSTVISKNIGQVFGMPLHWKPRVVMTPTLSSPKLSLWWQLAGTTVMTKLALRQFSILGISHGLVNIRITIVIYCHSQRFLESEYLSYYRVLNMLVRVTDSA